MKELSSLANDVADYAEQVQSPSSAELERIADQIALEVGCQFNRSQTAPPSQTLRPRRWGWPAVAGVAAAAGLLGWLVGPDFESRPNIRAEDSVSPARSEQPSTPAAPVVDEGPDRIEPTSQERVERPTKEPARSSALGSPKNVVQVPPFNPKLPSWRELADAGKFEEAIVAVKKEGVGQVVAQGSATDLLALGEAALHAHDEEIASSGLSTLRQRYSRSSEAEAATFHLARLAKRQGDTSRVLRYCEEYLRKWPRGHFPREVSGLQLELTPLGARSQVLAKRYLDQYPQGPHAALARKRLVRSR